MEEISGGIKQLYWKEIFVTGKIWEAIQMDLNLSRVEKDVHAWMHTFIYIYMSVLENTPQISVALEF